MPDYVIPPPPQAALPILGSESLFPIRRVLCVGRNYAAHRREMGGDDREPPFFFSKPADAVLGPGVNPAYPMSTSNLHHEVELVVALKAGGAQVEASDALELVYGYAVGVDLTRRDLQALAKDKGQPWEACKGFDQSGPCSPLTPWSGAPPSGRIWLSVNGQIRQDAKVSDMLWGVAEIISQASRLWRLAPGDLIFTGTPEGVGAISRGDLVTAGVEDVGELGFEVA